MCEMITETAGSTGGNTPGYTTSAVPTTLPIWYTYTDTHTFDERYPGFLDLNQ